MPYGSDKNQPKYTHITDNRGGDLPTQEGPGPSNATNSAAWAVQTRPVGGGTAGVAKQRAPAAKGMKSSGGRERSTSGKNMHNPY